MNSNLMEVLSDDDKNKVYSLLVTTQLAKPIDKVEIEIGILRKIFNDGVTWSDR